MNYFASIKYLSARVLLRKVLFDTRNCVCSLFYFFFTKKTFSCLYRIQINDLYIEKHVFSVTKIVVYSVIKKEIYRFSVVETTKSDTRYFV
jgi:hypothetical protein